MSKVKGKYAAFEHCFLNWQTTPSDFRLLADTEHSTLYGSLGEYQGNAIALRNTFIIDPNGAIAKVFQNVKPAAHSEEVLIPVHSIPDI